MTEHIPQRLQERVNLPGIPTPHLPHPSLYQESVNKYGSSTTLPKQAATGRFYTKKIDGRWWLVDPEGCLHLERSATSLRKGTSSRNKAAWNSRFGTDEKWLSTTQRELSEIGFHGTGAFCTGTYSLIQIHNASNPSSPLTLAPSFAFLSQFKSAKSYNYPKRTPRH